MNEDRIWIAMKYLAGVLLIAMLLMLVTPAFAQGDHPCQGGHNCNDVNTAVLDGDEFRALSLSQSLGGVDVSGCIVTTQWGIIIYQRQGYRYDVFCLARELDAVGKYADAAAMRCLHKIPTKLYGNRCLSVMNFEPPEPNPTRTLVGQVPNTNEDDDARYDALVKELAQVRMQQQEQQQQIEQQPAAVDDSAFRRSRAKEAYQKAKEGGE